MIPLGWMPLIRRMGFETDEGEEDGIEVEGASEAGDATFELV